MRRNQHNILLSLFQPTRNLLPVEVDSKMTMLRVNAAAATAEDMATLGNANLYRYRRISFILVNDFSLL